MTEINKRHGDRCSCRLLAEATGCDPTILSFSFCRSVLQRHWFMHCNHGCFSAGASKESSSRWRELGEMDPIKAILIKNN
jgi:hypothetical protein